MGLYSRSAQMVLASGGMLVSCPVSALHCGAPSSLPQPRFSVPPCRSSLLRASVHRKHLRPRFRSERDLRLSCTLAQGNEELTQGQQQPSNLGGDISASKSKVSTVVEHVVFFKVKDDQKIELLFQELQALKVLDGIIDLSAGKVLQILGANYTHVLHSRHIDRAALDAYAVHPSHQVAVKKLAPYIEDRLALDWEAVPVGLPIEGGHGAARIALMKLADGLEEEEISRAFGLLRGLSNKFPFIRQASAGKNFSPARAKGFNVGFVAMFDNLEELEQLNGNAELHAVLRRSSVGPSLSSFVIADIDSKRN